MIKVCTECKLNKPVWQSGDNALCEACCAVVNSRRMAQVELEQWSKMRNISQVIQKRVDATRTQEEKDKARARGDALLMSIRK